MQKNQKENSPSQTQPWLCVHVTFRKEHIKVIFQELIPPFLKGQETSGTYLKRKDIRTNCPLKFYSRRELKGQLEGWHVKIISCFLTRKLIIPH
jgi:hypothetical protein